MHLSFESYFFVLLVFIGIVIASIRRLGGNGEWYNHDQGSGKQEFDNEGMPSHHIYPSFTNCMLFYVLQIYMLFYSSS